MWSLQLLLSVVDSSHDDRAKRVAQSWPKKSRPRVTGLGVGKGGARQLVDGYVDHTRLERLMLRRSAAFIQERSGKVKAKPRRRLPRQLASALL
jgi:hypothetical protein